MGDITKNFSRKEFACKCGCGFDDVEESLVRLLQRLRSHYKASITVTSSCRCYAHNKAVGGSKGSRHLAGTAADIVVKGVPAREVCAYVDSKYKSTLGIGCYSNFTHIDMRGRRARW